MDVRPYDPSDREACLAVFESNVPDFFRAPEHEDLTAFLDALPGPYLVVEREGEGVVACGGMAREADRTTVALCWGMVRRDRQGQGVGRLLLEARLVRIQRDRSIAAVKVSTSQHTRGFYERHGFLLDRITADGFGPGIDRCDLRLALRR